MVFWHNWLKTISKKLHWLAVCILAASAPGPLALPVHAAQPLKNFIDLVFVIDNSGSMKKNDPQFVIRKTINDFVVKLPEQSRVGMVLFDENVRLLNRLRIISSIRVQENFSTSLAKIDYAGRYTNIPGGIERALYELKTNGRPDSQKAIVFVTDGMVTTGNQSKNRELTQWLKEDLTRELKQLGIRIYGVAFTEAADFSLIQTLASRTQGEYFRAVDTSGIPPAFEQIQTRINTELSHPPDIQPQGIQPQSVQSQGIEPQSIQPQSIQPPPMSPTTSMDASANFAGNGSVDRKPIVVVTHTPWMLYFWLTLITSILTAAAIFLFTKQQKYKHEPAAYIQPAIHLPEARIHDLDGACKGFADSFELNKANLTIGRISHNDICIPQTTVSKHHATIEYVNLAFYLTDLKSTNGTRINGKKLNADEPVRLRNGDRIAFGRYQFQFDMPEQIQFHDTVLLSRTSLNDPDDKATIMIDLEETSVQESLLACLQHHLLQIESLGSKYKSFVREHFTYDTLKALAVDGDENLNKSLKDQQLHFSSQVKNNIFYLICSLPVEIHGAANWYSATHGGFTQFASQWVKSDAYLTTKCDMLCIVTFGQIPTHWVSITTVPTHNEPDAVEIISVDFLNPDEKSLLALNNDQDGKTP